MTIRAINPQNGAALILKGVQIDNRFITVIQGKEFVLYAGLLDLAHQKGLKKLVVEILQLPNQENGNTAICKAVAETDHGDLFTDIGDANPRNYLKHHNQLTDYRYTILVRKAQPKGGLLFCL